MKSFVTLLIGLMTATLIGCGTNGIQGGTEADQLSIRGEVMELKQFGPSDSADGEDASSESDPNDPASSDDLVTPSQPDDVLGSMLVEGELEEDTSYDKAFIKVKNDTVIVQQQGENTVLAEFEDIKLGLQVEVIFTGPVQESYPVGATAGKIVILAKD